MMTNEQVKQYNKSIQAVSEFYSAIATCINSVFPIMREFVASATPDEIPESVLRDYAGRYNAAHPHRKINWRRLNRHQRAEAFWSDWPGEDNYVA